MPPYYLKARCLDSLGIRLPKAWLGYAKSISSDDIKNHYEVLKHYEIWHAYQVLKLLGAKDLSKLRILEPGCGSGIMGCLFALAGAQVTLLDYDKDVLKTAHQTAVKMGVGNRINFICGDFFKMPFAENVFDLVWNDGVIEHFDEPHKVVTRMAEVTKPGGKVIVSVPAKWTTHTWITRPLARWRGRYPFDKWGRERSYTAKELSKIMIASGLSGIESLNCHIYQGLVPGFLTARLRRPGLAPFIPALFNGFDWIEEKIPLLKNLGFISAAAGLKTQA